MGRKKKPFIGKKEGYRFQLVHRSQRDPLIADDQAPQYVLHPFDTDKNEETRQPKMEEDDYQARVYEQEKYGVYFDDDYNYMQHLKERHDKATTSSDNVDFVYIGSNKSKIKLPANAFPSQREDDVGLLNRGLESQGLHPEWDPDIVAALDDALDLDDPDNILEDDFMRKADVVDEAEYDADEGGYDDNENDMSRYRNDSFGSDECMNSMADDDNVSQFTGLSLTSSVVRRGEGLTHLDDRFDKILEEYEDNEIGAPDDSGDNISGDERRELVEQHLSRLIEEQMSLMDNSYRPLNAKKPTNAEPRDTMEESQIDLDDDNETESTESDSEESTELVEVEEKRELWDCESILETRSTAYNHPKIIANPPKKNANKISDKPQIILSKKTGIPLGVLPGKSPKEKVVSVKTNITRSKNETKEEKRRRKLEVKGQKKVRRQQKKSTKVAFKAEQISQERSMVNTNHSKGVTLL
ncbi:Protein LTV1-like protein [Trichoplax sp. H2]|nr:Protein LTV1-like protein [Trichoplax sp. H2]|eukprot:RDD47825.1 Protein LTV1-like protein [Trichoplax sp. H2]